MKTFPKNYIFRFQDAVWTKINRRYVIVIIGKKENSFLDIINSIYYTTPSGLDILNSLLAKRPVLSIIKSLAKKYRITSQRAQKDVIDFIGLLKKKRLFVPIP